MKQLHSILAIGIAGLGVGWLVGLSTSPVVAAVIAALLAAVTGLASGGSSTEVLSKRVQIAAGSVAALAVGIALGATLGLNYRNETAWFSKKPDERAAELRVIVDRWNALGVPRELVVNRLLNRELPVGQLTGSETKTSESMPGGLVAMDTKTCAELVLAAPGDILNKLAASARPALQKLGRQAQELKLPDSFAAQLRDVLCSKEAP